MTSMINKPRIKQTAHQAYQERYQEALELVTRIRRQLTAHKAQEAKEPRNWGYAGDLGHVNSELKQVLASLGEDQARRELERDGEY